MPVSGGICSWPIHHLKFTYDFSVINQMEPTSPTVAVLLDAEKAFDSLEWSFLYVVLQKLGMPIDFLI